jgi:hypothetical protein
MVGKESMRASFHPLCEGRQHAIRPDIRFNPGPAAPDLSGGVSPRGNHGRALVRLSVFHASTSLPPLAPRPLRRFNATMETLTPVRLSSGAQVSLFHVPNLPTIPPPTTWWTPVVAFAPYPSAQQISRVGTAATQCLPTHGSRLHHSLAGSPITPGRNGFVILRTGRSPPAALHPASRRRSCSRLQAGEGIPGEDLHLSD